MLFIQSHAEPHFELYLLPADAENPGQAPDTKLTKLVIGDRTAGPDCASESAFSQEGQLYFRKDAKKFWPVAFLSTRKGTMTVFVIYLPDNFGLRCKMVEVHPKARKIELPAGNVERNRDRHAKPNPKTFYHRAHREHGERTDTAASGSAGAEDWRNL
jgi:hypothetical protein